MVEQPVAALLRRIDSTLAQEGDGFPQIGDVATGRWTRTPDADFSGGFWTGLLWLAAAATGEPAYARHAETWAARLRPRTAADTVFRGFLFWYGAGIAEPLGLGSPEVRQLARDGALAFATAFDRTRGLFPVGADDERRFGHPRGEANIDSVPGTVPLLAGTARQLAFAHAGRHVELCVNPDGSARQAAELDPETGALLRRYSPKGSTSDSTWLRAQSWAMLGLTQAAHLDPARFTNDAVRVSDWFLDHLPTDRVCYWDFDDPAIPDAPRDTSGTAIAAAALVKLAPLAGDRYRDAAGEIVGALVERHLSAEGILHDGCLNLRRGIATANELVWGSYFLFEALLGLAGTIDPTRV